MELNHKTTNNSRISVGSAGQNTPALAGFVVCPCGSSFVGSPVVSQLAIYQMAYERAMIAASQQSRAQMQLWSQNWSQN